MNVGGAIQPRHGRLHGSLKLAHHQRKSVDEQHDVGAFGLAVADAELVDQLKSIVLNVFEIYQIDGDVGVVFAERHGLVALEPFGEFLVGTHQARAVDRQQYGAQLVDDLIGTFRLCGNFGIEADKRFFDFRLDKHFCNLALQGGSGHIFPPCAVTRRRLTNLILNIEVHTRHRLDDEVLNGVYFGEGHIIQNLFLELSSFL